MKRLKELEHEGYQFEGAESSFELVVRKQLGRYRSFFELEHFKIIGEQPTKGEFGSSAIIKVKVDGEDEITAAEGDGPVHALDSALRKALETFYPELANVHLTDYKVRVINGKDATAAKVRVLLQSTDGDAIVITSYSIHYTKLYDPPQRQRCRQTFGPFMGPFFFRYGSCLYESPFV